MSQNQQQRNRPAKPPIKQSSNYSGGGGGGQRTRPPINSQQQQQQQQQSNRGGNRQYQQRGGRGRGRGQRGGRGRGQRGGQRGRNYNQQQRGYNNQQQQQYGGYQNQSQQQQQQAVSSQAPSSAAPQSGAAPMNTNNDNQQQSGGPSARRPPIKQTNNNMFAQFEKQQAQSGQQQQQQQQQQQASKASKPPKAMNQQQQQQQQSNDIQNENNEEKQMMDNNQQQQETQGGTNDDPQQQKKQKSPPRKQKASISQSAKQSMRREPPWFEFTGKDKQSPVEAGWAHRVRQVLSGDTVRLSLLKSPNDKLKPSKIMQVTLDGIRAPLVQRFSNNRKNQSGKKREFDSFQLTKDEPFGYEAREFVRKFVMNKNVFYAVWKVNQMQPQTANRYYGDIYVQVDKNKRQSLTRAVIAAGFAKVKEKNHLNSLSSKEVEKLLESQKKIKEKKQNIWSFDEKDLNPPTPYINAHIRDIIWLTNDQHEQFAKKYINRPPLKGIIDQVINGSTLRVELCIKDKNYQHVNVVVNIAGVLAPKPKMRDNKNQSGNNKGGKKKKGGKGGKNQRSSFNQYEPEYDLTAYAECAKEWTQERLLGQQVQVKILTAANRNIYAQIIHPGGRIGPSLLKKGLAEYESWTAKATDNEEQKYLKAAADIAKKDHLNIWSVKPVSKASGMNKSQFVTVVQVVSGDTVVVEDVNKNKERYTLSSIRAPRLGTRKRQNNDEKKDDKSSQKSPSKSPSKSSQKSPQKKSSPQSDKGGKGGGKSGKNKGDDKDDKGGKNKGGGGKGGKNDKSGKGDKNDDNKEKNKKKVDNKNKQQTQIPRDPTKDQYLARVAKEFVRKKCIGKKVRLVPEYERTSQSAELKKRGFNTQKFASIYLKNEKNPNKPEENLALTLITKGYAEIIRHSKQQLERSEDYNLLQKAFEDAQKKGIGINISDKKKLERMQENQFADYSLTDKSLLKHKRIELLNWLRGNKVNAVVEYVFSANRLKLLIPSRNAAIAVMLADVRCGGWSGRSDKYRDEAKEYLESTILQREVVVKITATDMNQNRGGKGRGKGRGRGGRGSRRGRRGGGGRGRGGKDESTTEPSENPNLLGHIYFEDKNVAEYLIEQGLATVITRKKYPYGGGGGLTSQRGGPPSKFLDLQEIARNANRGVHQEINRYRNDDGMDEKQQERRQKQMAKNDKTGREINVVVSHIESATLFYVNDADNDKMQNMNQAMVELKKNFDKPGRINPGKHYAALYDGYYARAKVINRDTRRDNQQQNNDDNNKDGSRQNWFVMFIDYGNRASIAKKQFAILPEKLRKDKIPPLAMRCQLAGLHGPDKVRDSSMYYNAGTFFSHYAMDQKLKMKILCDDQYYRTWYVDLFVGDQSINQLLAKEGFVTLDKKSFTQLTTSSLSGSTNDKIKEDIEKYLNDIKLNIAEAKGDHKNLYRFGDIDDAEDDNLEPVNNKKNKKGDKNKKGGKNTKNDKGAAKGGKKK